MNGASFFAAIVSLTLLVASPSHARAGHGGEVLARYPNGTYLENLAVTRDGAVTFTNYFAKTIEQWRPGRAARTLARLPAYPVNLLPLDGGWLVLTHGAKFTDGPTALSGTNRLLWLDKRGRVTRTLDVPDLVFGNGMVAAGRSAVLVTDSVRGHIVKVDLVTGRSTVWLRDKRLEPDPARPELPAANGLRRSGQHIYVTSSAARSIFRILVDRRLRPAGPMTLMTTAPGADDMAVARDGTVYLATHGQRVVKIEHGRSVIVVDRNVDGCTSAALSTDGRILYILGTGGYFEGGKKQATLVRVRLSP